MKIEIFGTGCAKCAGLEKSVKRIIEKMNIAAEVTKVSDLDTMVERGVMASPAMAIDGEIVVNGRVPGDEEIRKLLSKK